MVCYSWGRTRTYGLRVVRPFINSGIKAKTSFAVDSIMTLKENVKLRSEESTTAEVLTMIAADAKV